MVQAASWEVCGHPWGSHSPERVGDFRLPASSAGGGKIRGARLGVGVGLTLGGTAGSASPARSCRKQVNSLMASIFSDVPRQGIPKENHHAHPLRGNSWHRRTGAEWGAGCPTHCRPEVPTGGPSILWEPWGVWSWQVRLRLGNLMPSGRRGGAVWGRRVPG